jgi:RimJ/RimL family protein N-acetyltransferase
MGPRPHPAVPAGSRPRSATPTLDPAATHLRFCAYKEDGEQTSKRLDNGYVDIVLKTPRLTLRQFTEGDVGNLFDLNSDPGVMRYLNGGRPTPREELRDEVIPFHLAVYERLDRLGTWAAEASATGEFLGWFHFRPGLSSDITNIDLGYRLRRSAWNMGYATEGSRGLINMGFTELGIERVFGHTMTVNAASRRVMEKCGLTLVRTTLYEGPEVIEGSEHGEVEYAVTKLEWEARAAGEARH